MLSIIYGRKKRRAISSCLIAVLVIATIAGAVLSAPVAVYALSAGGLKSTIASIIISLLLQTGVAPTNTSWLNALNSSYGYTIETAISEGLLTESAGTLIDTGLSSAIESASAYTDLGLGDIFTTTLADEGVIVGTGGVNIANTAIHAGTAGTIGAFAGAAVIGVGVGVLANHIREKITNFVKYGLPMSKDTINGIANNMPEGYNKVYYSIRKYGSNEYTIFYFLNSDCICVGYPVSNNDNGAYNSRIANKDGSTPNGLRMNYTNSTITDERIITMVSGPAMGTGNNIFLGRKIDYYADSLNDADNIIERWQGGNINLPVTTSPDLIGKNGNLFYDGEDNIIPGVENQIPTGSDMIPVNMETYEDFADDANQNTDDGKPEDNGVLFEDLINDLIVGLPTIPDTPIIPDDNVTVPTAPDRPVEPSQPSIPDKPDIGQEDIEEALQGATTIDLRSVFPFCIPFDLYNLILIFDTGENRRAPHINFTFPGTDWIIDVDLAPFDTASGILRLLELIVFIAGLAVATRKLIGAGG